MLLVAAVLAAICGAILAQREPSRIGRVPARAGLALLPAAAQASVSAAVGAGDPAFRVIAQRDGAFGVHNGGMAATFDRFGLSVADGATRARLQPLSLSSGAGVETLSPRAPRARANEVAYAYPSLHAWYRNGPAGLEQGFVVTRPPLPARGHAGFAGSNLDLSLAVHSDALLRSARDGQSVSFTRAGAPTLRLGSLTVTDARGRLLSSRFAIAPGLLRLSIDAAGARYPITIDPLIQAGTLLTGAGELGAGEFGLSVAVSADGTTALVGAPRDNDFAGAAWVFVRSGSIWTQQGELTPGAAAEGSACAEEATLNEEESECSFGASVALSGDGNTAIVGAPRDRDFQGGAWVFTRSGSTWTREPEELSGTGEIGQGHFGKQVAISADGSVVLVAAPNDRYGHGAVWAFERSSTGWLPIGEGKITLSGVTGTSYFGRGIALSPDASTAIIGAPGEGEYRGAVWMFTRSPSGWVEQAKVTAGEEQGAARFGFAVVASEGAETVLVGGPRDDGNVGAAWVFDRSGDALVQQGPKLSGAGETGEGLFGRTLAIAASASTALIGAPHDDSGRGAAWLFSQSPAGWTGEKFSADESRGQFGASIALSADGAIPLFGEPWSSNKAGVVWEGLPPPNVTAVEPSRGPAGGGTSVTITGAGFTEVAAVYFGTSLAHYDASSSSSIVAVSPPGARGSTVDVTVVTAHGTSGTTAADHFAYLGPETGAGAEAGEGEDASAEEESSEEGVGTLGLTASRGSGCRFALLSSKVAVLGGGRAALRLRRLGTGRCAGKLTLSVRVEGKHGKLQARSIGGARFAISKSTPVTVRVRLNSLGLSLLRSGHGQTSAKLVVVRLAPLPARAQSASVRLRLSH